MTEENVSVDQEDAVDVLSVLSVANAVDVEG